MKLLKKIFECTKANESKEKIKTFDDKSEKKRSQVVMKTLEDCNKIQYNTKIGKRYYYKKIDFLFQNWKWAGLKKFSVLKVVRK